MLATRRYLCEKCNGDITPGQQFDIIEGVFQHIHCNGKELPIMAAKTKQTKERKPHAESVTAYVQNALATAAYTDKEIGEMVHEQFPKYASYKTVAVVTRFHMNKAGAKLGPVKKAKEDKKSKASEKTGATEAAS